MMRLLPWSAAAAAACGVAFFIASASAQTTQPKCGGERWSKAEMRYVTLPCTAQPTKTADGKATCGAERWSKADMHYAQMPCTAQPTQTAEGKATCGTPRWSKTEMRYVQLPCTTK